MPNWVTNILEIKGSAESLKEFQQAVAGSESFDFQKILPMPESLNIVSGSDTAQSVYAYLLTQESETVARIDCRNMMAHPEFYDDDYFQRITKRLEEIKNASKCSSQYEMSKNNKLKDITGTSTPATYQDYVDFGKIYTENYRKYGCMTWYDWCRENWGSKWNAVTPEFSGDPDSDELFCQFDTAWTPPTGIVEAMPEFLKQNKISDIEIEWKWAEEQGYFGGIFTIKGTEPEVTEQYFEACDEAYALCEEVIGYSYELEEGETDEEE